LIEKHWKVLLKRVSRYDDENFLSSARVTAHRFIFASLDEIRAHDYVLTPGRINEVTGTSKVPVT
jgi:hypothetical protein